jgi:hypothetical protein
VVQCPQEPAADDCHTKAHRGEERERKANACAFADAALADLLGLDLPLVVEDENTNGLMWSSTRVLERLGRGVGRRLVLENCQHDGVVLHERSLLPGESPS